MVLETRNGLDGNELLKTYALSMEDKMAAGALGCARNYGRVGCRGRLMQNWRYWNLWTYFAKIMTRKPKLGIWTNMTELSPFLESKKWYLLFKGILWSRDFTWKPIIDPFQTSHFCCVEFNANLRQLHGAIKKKENKSKVNIWNIAEHSVIPLSRLTESSFSRYLRTRPIFYG